eukprot:scaffold7625_cov277-Pinguiococcus_pyrenoidosus.AAC.9
MVLRKLLSHLGSIAISVLVWGPLRLLMVLTSSGQVSFLYVISAPMIQSHFACSSPAGDARYERDLETSSTSPQ